MKFNDYVYERCNQQKVETELKEIVEKMKNAASFSVFCEAFDAYNQLVSEVDTMYSLASTRHNINTKDAFYKEENDFWDGYLPLFQKETHEVEKCILASSYLEELKKKYPKTYFLGLAYSQKTFSPDIVEELQEENRLVSQYDKLLAEAELSFEGETYTLSSIGVKLEDKDETVRESALHVVWEYFSEVEKTLDDIYDKLVHVRDAMAKKLGYANYIELGYLRMNRFDYDEKAVSTYREEVLKEVVPVANMLYERQRKRLGKQTLSAHNEKFEFQSGNPMPKYGREELVERASVMYHEMAKETGEFFDFMREKALMDLESKPNKAGGGYCTYFPTFRSPFIFANFNGTSGDVDVLTHERVRSGHLYGCNIMV